jgi:hypothetical protein
MTIDTEEKRTAIITGLAKEVIIFRELHRSLTQTTSQNYKRLVRAIKSMSTPITPITSKNYHIGVANDKVLNLETLKQPAREYSHGIRTVCSQEYNPNISTNIIDDVLRQMSNNTNGSDDDDNLTKIKDMLGMSLLCSDKFPAIFTLSNSCFSKKLLIQLYKTTFGPMVLELDYKALSNWNSMSFKVALRDKRFIIFKNVPNNAKLSQSFLEDYFDRVSIRDVGGNGGVLHQ